MVIAPDPTPIRNLSLSLKLRRNIQPHQQQVTLKLLRQGFPVATMSVTLHTTLGDLKIEVFCESVPKTAEVCRDFARHY